MKAATFNCVICDSPYDLNKSRANFRGYCSRKCETVAENKCGFKPNEPMSSANNRDASSKFSKLSMALRRTTPGADPIEEEAPVVELKTMVRREYTMTVKIIPSLGVSEQEMMQAVLEGECTLNANSRVRFHFDTPKEIK